MSITKPPGIESDVFKSAIWDELTQGREFAQSDAPALSLLCQWYNLTFAEQIGCLPYANWVNGRVSSDIPCSATA